MSEGLVPCAVCVSFASVGASRPVASADEQPSEQPTASTHSQKVIGLLAVRARVIYI